MLFFKKRFLIVDFNYCSIDKIYFIRLIVSLSLIYLLIYACYIVWTCTLASSSTMVSQYHTVYMKTLFPDNPLDLGHKDRPIVRIPWGYSRLINDVINDDAMMKYS